MDPLPSTLRFARTGKPRTDTVLNRVETLLDLYQGSADDYTRLVKACDLFFTLDYWLKYYQSGPSYEKGQAGGVQLLYGMVVSILCKAFNNCTVNVLPRELELMFGRELTGEGYKVDVEWGQAGYAGKEELGKYRLSFKLGKAYQFPWWQPSGSESVSVLAESSRCQPTTVVHLGGDKPNWGYCVMTMNREIYMAKHAPATKVDGRVKLGAYHSYYLEGQPVQFAGSMLIVAGKVSAVCPDSGHYKPNDNNTLAVLQALIMFGVALDAVAVFPWSGDVVVMANDFIDAKADWVKLRTNQGKNRRVNAGDWLEKQPPEIKRWVDWVERMNAVNSKAPVSAPVVSGPPAPGFALPSSYVSYSLSPVGPELAPPEAPEVVPQEAFIPDVNDVSDMYAPYVLYGGEVPVIP
jgi:hypothetical protein